MGFKISTLNPNPPNSNPFDYDSYNMGTQLGNNCIVMYGNHQNEICNYLVLVNTATGELIKVEFEPDFYGKLANEIQHTLSHYGNLREGEEFIFSFNDGWGLGWCRPATED